MQRILCVNPEHKESNPSMVVYEDYAHCFSCGYRVSTAKLGHLNLMPARRREPENLVEALAYVKALPLARVRGLDLPADQEGYYLVWPDGSYYKKRKWIAENKVKYMCPRGHAKPLFIPYVVEKANTLVIVEGELNALSLASLKPNFSICSPGGVGDFKNELLERYSKFFLGHTRFRLILDYDIPGMEAAIRMKKLLMKRTPYVELKLMKRDCNDLLQSGELSQEVAAWGGHEASRERAR